MAITVVYMQKLLGRKAATQGKKGLAQFSHRRRTARCQDKANHLSFIPLELGCYTGDSHFSERKYKKIIIKKKDYFSCSAKTRNTSFKYEGLFPQWHSAVVTSWQHPGLPLVTLQPLYSARLKKIKLLKWQQKMWADWVQSLKQLGRDWWEVSEKREDLRHYKNNEGKVLSPLTINIKRVKQEISAFISCGTPF